MAITLDCCSSWRWNVWLFGYINGRSRCSLSDSNEPVSWVFLGCGLERSTGAGKLLRHTDDQMYTLVPFVVDDAHIGRGLVGHGAIDVHRSDYMRMRCRVTDSLTKPFVMSLCKS